MEPIQSTVAKHRGHKHLLVRGDFGPHRAKMICLDCAGEFVKWESINIHTYEYLKGVKYQCASNKTTKKLLTKY